MRKSLYITCLRFVICKLPKSSTNIPYNNQENEIYNHLTSCNSHNHKSDSTLAQFLGLQFLLHDNEMRKSKVCSLQGMAQKYI